MSAATAGGRSRRRSALASPGAGGQRATDRKRAVSTSVLGRPLRLDLESFARAAGLHPDLVRRLVALGLLEASADAASELWFPPSQLAAAAWIQRLRAAFSLNYAALGLVLDLLARIEALEAAQRARPRPSGGSDRRWT
jgi:chaperone modulatory protein CbpM